MHCWHLQYNSFPKSATSAPLAPCQSVALVMPALNAASQIDDKESTSFSDEQAIILNMHFLLTACYIVLHTGKQGSQNKQEKEAGVNANWDLFPRVHHKESLKDVN
jgi:hypothetical protein